MKIKKVLFFFVLICNCNSLIGQSIENFDLEKLLNDFDDNTHIEIGILQEGAFETMAFLKNKDEIKRVKSNPDKLFEIGSITKVFTAYLTHLMISSNSEIQLTSRLSDLGLPFKIHHKNKTRLIHLLNHTSNLPKMPLNYVEGMILHPKNPYLIYSEKKVLKYYKRHKTKKSLGEKFKYSNYGYGILGIILSKQKQKSYREIFKEEITNKLGLKNTQIGIEEKDYPRLFLKDKESINCLWKLNQMESEGGGYSTVNDLLSFSKIIIQHDDFSKAVQVSLNQLGEESLAINEKEKIAQGWRIRILQNRKILYHDGGSRGYKSFIGIDKKHKMSVVILSQNCGLNKNNKVLKTLGLEILNRLSKKKN